MSEKKCMHRVTSTQISPKAHNNTHTNITHTQISQISHQITPNHTKSHQSTQASQIICQNVSKKYFFFRGNAVRGTSQNHTKTTPGSCHQGAKGPWGGPSTAISTNIPNKCIIYTLTTVQYNQSGDTEKYK